MMAWRLLTVVCLCIAWCSGVVAEEWESSSTLLLNQVQKGRLYGSTNSNDVAKRILTANDGSLYVAGETTPRKLGDLGWGDAEPGEETGETDLFLAKMTSGGNLVWVKRTGSRKKEQLKDAKLTANGIYLCGSTEGDYGNSSLGYTDSFVMKFTLDGDKAWRHPFQFGSEGLDSCNSLSVDPRSNKIYVAGSTTGRVFGSSKPANGTSNMFAAVFEDRDDDLLGLNLLQGRQRGEHGNSSGDSIAIAKNRVFVMTTHWDLELSDEKVMTYLNTFDPRTLKMHKLHAIRASGEGTFHGTRMVAVNGTGDVYMVGKTFVNKDKSQYHAVKFGLSRNEGRGGVAWATAVGTVSPRANMSYQAPAIIADISDHVLYVAGVEDGFYTSMSGDNSSIVVVPFYKLRMGNGKVAQRWHRTILTPDNKEELTDMALDAGKEVVYTGVWNSGTSVKSNALVGSFGSSRYSSGLSRSLPATGNDALMRSVGTEEKARQSGHGPGRIVTYILLTCGALGVMATAMFVYALRSSRPAVEVDDARFGITTIDMEELRRQVAESHRETGLPGLETVEIVAGGSAGPK